MMYTINDDIIRRTKLLFKTMFKIEIEAGIPYAVNPDADTGWDISGVISVAGDLSGLITMRYPKNLAHFMLKSSKLHDNKSDISQSFLNDMIGEVANTIAGNVMSERGLNELLLSIPITIRGENHIINWPPNTEITAVPFIVGVDIFVVQVGLR